MAANSPVIKMTIRLENELYKKFHEKVSSIGATHNGVIKRLVSEYVKKPAVK